MLIFSFYLKLWSLAVTFYRTFESFVSFKRPLALIWYFILWLELDSTKTFQFNQLSFWISISWWTLGLHSLLVQNFLKTILKFLDWLNLITKALMRLWLGKCSFWWFQLRYISNWCYVWYFIVEETLWALSQWKIKMVTINNHGTKVVCTFIIKKLLMAKPYILIHPQTSYMISHSFTKFSL